MKADESNSFFNLMKNGGLKGSAEKAARLVLLLGVEEAARVMAQLAPAERELLTRKIAEVQLIDTVEAKSILSELGDSFADIQTERTRGGIEAAREILREAFGNKTADEIIARAIPDSVPRPFSFLNNYSMSELTSLLSKENERILSLVMAYIKPKLASQILATLPNEQRTSVVLRMARTESVSQDTINTIESKIQEKIRITIGENTEELDGRSALAGILRYMNITDERRLLQSMEDSDPTLVEQVKEKLYTMDTVLHIREIDLQSIVRDMENKEIAMLLKGQSQIIRDTITGAISAHRQALVADESILLGPVPRSEVDSATRTFLERLRKGEEDGAYVIIREEEDLVQ